VRLTINKLQNMSSLTMGLLEMTDFSSTCHGPKGEQTVKSRRGLMMTSSHPVVGPPIKLAHLQEKNKLTNCIQTWHAISALAELSCAENHQRSIINDKNMKTTANDIGIKT